MSELFRLVFFDTNHDNKHEANSEHVHEYLGNREAIFKLWYNLNHVLEKKHVFVFNLAGDVIEMGGKLGIHAMQSRLT